MGKKQRPDLSGAALSRFLRRLLKGEAELDDQTRSRLLSRLEAEVASLRLRRHAAVDDQVMALSGEVAASVPGGPAMAERAAPPLEHRDRAVAPEQDAPEPFDPYDPNVVVLVRTRGPAEARSALTRIEGLEKLHLLAREQRLSVAPDIADPSLLRAAIVEAAERRIANRRAAAS